MSGGNLFFYDPFLPFDPEDEPRIIGINVDNQGTVRIHPNATFGFKAEIADYVPGGATLGPGIWEVIGSVPADPFPNDGQAFVPGRATLDVSIARIINEDAYLGRIDFGDTNGDGIDDGYSAEDYDTELAVRRSQCVAQRCGAIQLLQHDSREPGHIYATTQQPLHDSGQSYQ